MVLAYGAAIQVFATGGLGGVHRGAETSLDISADLIELGRTPVTVVSSGCKSFLDIRKTLEFLETQGVTVGTFADGRDGIVDFPAFWTRNSGIPSPIVIQDEAEAAAMICEYPCGLDSSTISLQYMSFTFQMYILDNGRSYAAALHLALPLERYQFWANQETMTRRKETFARQTLNAPRKSNTG